jgi:hypothetical protein
MADEKFDPICELEFTDAQTGKKLTARLGPPVFDQSNHRYYCLSEIAGLEKERDSGFIPTVSLRH